MHYLSFPQYIWFVIFPANDISKFSYMDLKADCLFCIDFREWIIREKKLRQIDIVILWTKKKSSQFKEKALRKPNWIQKYFLNVYTTFPCHRKPLLCFWLTSYFSHIRSVFPQIRYQFSLMTRLFCFLCSDFYTSDFVKVVLILKEKIICWFMWSSFHTAIIVVTWKCRWVYWW